MVGLAALDPPYGHNPDPLPEGEGTADYTKNIPPAGRRYKAGAD